MNIVNVLLYAKYILQKVGHSLLKCSGALLRSNRSWLKQYRPIGIKKVVRCRNLLETTIGVKLAEQFGTCQLH